MRVRVLLFAALRESVGEKSLELELRESATLADLLAQLEAEHASLARYRGRMLVARNQERAPLATPLSDGDEIALLPPVSGGSERVWIDSAPLSLDALLREVMSPAMGGVVTFTGVVRNRARGESIDHLEYEAYAPMAIREMTRLCDAIEAELPGTALAVEHRVGTLAVGDIAVVIAAAAPHRAEAFTACRAMIDRLKERAPIWKKEIGPDGAEWVGLGP